MNQLDKLFDILKKSGENKIVVFDRQAGDFYVISKWEEYEKLSGAKDIEKVQEKVANEAAATAPNGNNLRDNSEPDDLYDEERFFFEQSV
jgi:hypothetical protein